MTHVSKQIGLACVVLDGCIRDKTENRGDTLPIYCRGVAPGGPHKGGKAIPMCQLPVQGLLSKQAILLSGMMIGIIVVPLLKADEMLKEALERISTEDNWYKRIAAGESTVDIFGLKKPPEYNSIWSITFLKRLSRVVFEFD